MDTLTTTQAAEYCGVHFRTVIRWINKGLLVSFKLPGRGDNRIVVRDLANFMLENDMPIPDDLLDRLADQAQSRVEGSNNVIFCSTSDWQEPLGLELQSAEFNLFPVRHALDLGFHLATHGGLICIDSSFFPLNPLFIARWLGEITFNHRCEMLIFERSRIGDTFAFVQQARLLNISTTFHDDIDDVSMLASLIIKQLSN